MRGRMDRDGRWRRKERASRFRLRLAKDYIDMVALHSNNLCSCFKFALQADVNKATTEQGPEPPQMSIAFGLMEQTDFLQSLRSHFARLVAT